MRKLFNFLCPHCGAATEKLVSTDLRVIDCECGEKATRTISMPTVKLDGTDPSFPGAYEKWARVREENRVIKGKRSYVGHF